MKLSHYPEVDDSIFLIVRFIKMECLWNFVVSLMILYFFKQERHNTYYKRRFVIVLEYNKNIIFQQISK